MNNLDFNSKESREKRLKWFQHDRFGMFIHWGLYTIPARGAWVRYSDGIDDEHYAPFFKEFNPVRYDPYKWAKLAKAAGMKYAVLTAKHHEGFCLFDSKYTDFKSTNTPCGKDLVKEYVEAFREEGLKVGLYYSLVDWHHPDYPKFEGVVHSEAFRAAHPKPDFNNYLTYMHNQIEELLTNYGKIDIMWLDYSYGEMQGEKWGASKIVEMVRKYQPDMLMDNRLEVAGSAAGSLSTANPTPYSGDFMCPESMVPYECPRNELGEPIPWETCMSLADGFAYNVKERQCKEAIDIVRDLTDCVSKNGNLLLNVTHDSLGCIPKKQEEVLLKVGQWMEENGESIYGCGMAENLRYQDHGRYTKNGNKLYLHLYEKSNRPIRLEGLLDKIECIRLLRDGSEVLLLDPKSFFGHLYTDYPGDAFFFYGGRSEPLPDVYDTVFEITLKE